MKTGIETVKDFETTYGKYLSQDAQLRILKALSTKQELSEELKNYLEDLEILAELDF